MCLGDEDVRGLHVVGDPTAEAAHLVRIRVRGRVGVGVGSG